MRTFALTAAIGAACLGLAACGGGESGNTAANNTAAEDDGAEATGGEGNAAGSASAGGATASGGGGDWKGARIVEEGGVTYRVNADGTRVRLGDTDARIVVENGVRYRVDPGGTRVRINEQGLDINMPDIDVPNDIDVGINKKGNLDIDVNDGDKIPEKKQ
jgi:hypothetical protein